MKRSSAGLTPHKPTFVLTPWYLSTVEYTSSPPPTSVDCCFKRQRVVQVPWRFADHSNLDVHFEIVSYVGGLQVQQKSVSFIIVVLSSLQLLLKSHSTIISLTRTSLMNFFREFGCLIYVLQSSVENCCLTVGVACVLLLRVNKLLSNLLHLSCLIKVFYMCFLSWQNVCSWTNRSGALNTDEQKCAKMYSRATKWPLDSKPRVFRVLLVLTSTMLLMQMNKDVQYNGATKWPLWVEGFATFHSTCNNDWPLNTCDGRGGHYFRFGNKTVCTYAGTCGFLNCVAFSNLLCEVVL